LRYHVFQMIAPFHGALVPSPGDFHPVLCHDLSCGGFSFFDSTPPDFRQLVVELKSASRLIYMVARVLHCRQVLVDAAGNVHSLSRAWGSIPDTSQRTTRSTLLIGCQFVRALRRGPLTDQQPPGPTSPDRSLPP
jgi:hypothetical protein